MIEVLSDYANAPSDIVEIGTVSALLSWGIHRIGRGFKSVFDLIKAMLPSLQEIGPTLERISKEVEEGSKVASGIAANLEAGLEEFGRKVVRLERHVGAEVSRLDLRVGTLERSRSSDG